MDNQQAWLNFDLGEEISIAGVFLYNGMRALHEMRRADDPEAIFEVLYNTSVGIERLLKVAVILLEHSKDSSNDDLAKSLITHSHIDLMRRVRSAATVHLHTQHNALLQLLTVFYKSHRYGRFSSPSPVRLDREVDAFLEFAKSTLNVNIQKNDMFLPPNHTDKIRTRISKLVRKIANELYQVISNRARLLNIYTYEISPMTKAAKIFLSQETCFNREDILWKEHLLYFMNTSHDSGLISFLRSIEPLDFDPALAGDYLLCFKSEAAKQEAMSELEGLYDDLPNLKQRLDLLSLLGDPLVFFDEHDNDNGDEEAPA